MRRSRVHTINESNYVLEKDYNNIERLFKDKEQIKKRVKKENFTVEGTKLILNPFNMVWTLKVFVCTC